MSDLKKTEISTLTKNVFSAPMNSARRLDAIEALGKHLDDDNAVKILQALVQGSPEGSKDKLAGILALQAKPKTA